jgi:farnesol dehydrogenase
VRIVVTGGTGYLGRAIVAALAERGHDVVVFARHASLAGLPGRAVDGDVRDARALIFAAAGCDALCHTAALVSLWRPRAREFDEVNVGGLEHALEAARQHRLRRIVYTSSFLALPPSDGDRPLAANDYQRTKVAADRVARAAAAQGVPIVCLYPGVVYGPGVETEGNLVGRLVRDHLAGRLPGIIGADRLWSFAYVEEVAAAHVAALERGQPGARYMLGGDNAPQMRLFEHLRALTGCPLPRRIPFALATALGAAEQLRARLTGRPPRLTPGVVKIFRHHWALASEEAARELGYRPIPLVEGLRKTLASLGLEPAGRPHEPSRPQPSSGPAPR